MFTGRAESRYVSIGQELQSDVEPLADRLRNDCTVEERERTEGKRFASHFVEFDTRQGLVDVVAGVASQNRYSVMHPNRLEHFIQALLERLEHWVIHWIGEVDQPRPVVSSEDDIPAWPRHTGYLLHCQLWSVEPGNDAERDHEVEGAVLEGQGIDIAKFQGKQIGDLRLRCMLLRQLDHDLNGINRIDAEPALGQSNRQEPSAAANL